MNKLISFSTVAVSYALPLLALAQVRDADTLFTRILDLLNKVVPVIVALAVVWFIWGVFTYVLSGADEEKRKGARQTMLYGIIAIAVMVSVWGLVAILTGTFRLNNQPELPPLLPGTR